MKHKGRIAEWNDERGFGFVVPQKKGPRAFLHISAMQSSQRPQQGDQVHYSLVQDEQGRWQAQQVTYAAITSRITLAPRVVLAMGALAVLLLLWGMQWMPTLMAGTYGLASVVAFLLYAKDKRAAQQKAWRVAEQSLHMVSVLGGWPGALLGQHFFHHKTAKASFQVLFVLTVVINVLGAWWLLHSGEWESIQTLWLESVS